MVGHVKIYKYEVPLLQRHNEVLLPQGAEPLAAGKQGAAYVMWVKVNLIPNRQYERRYFTWVGTGHDFPDTWEHVATLIDEPFVWHLMEER